MSLTYKWLFNPNSSAIEEMRERGIDRMQIEEIIILPYLIITESSIAPILTYVLKKNVKERVCQFAFEREIVVTSQNVDAIVENSRDVLRKIMDASIDKYAYFFKGLKAIGRKLIILFELKISYIDLLVSSSSSSPIVFATISELLNDLHVDSYDVPEEVAHLFANNLEMCVLRNERDAIYETPSVYYAHSPFSVIEHDALFCPPKYKVSESLSVQRLEHYGRSPPHTNAKSGLIRATTFMRRHRVEFGDVVLNDRLFDGFDSVSVLSVNNESAHYIKNHGQVVSLSYYAT
jgi:hypothetical protein